MEWIVFAILAVAAFAILIGMNIWQWREFKSWMMHHAVIVEDGDEMDRYCADCGRPLQAVRPGKWQCPKCE